MEKRLTELATSTLGKWAWLVGVANLYAPPPCSWNDVHQHWSSLCKLLLETLIRLEATYAELKHILMIRYSEEKNNVFQM